MLATVVISLLIAIAVVFAIRSIVKSRATGGCEACGGDCSRCSSIPEIRMKDDN